jgi:hypothetical protein
MARFSACSTLNERVFTAVTGWRVFVMIQIALSGDRQAHYPFIDEAIALGDRVLVFGRPWHVVTELRPDHGSGGHEKIDIRQEIFHAIEASAHGVQSDEGAPVSKRRSSGVVPSRLDMER